MRTYRIVEITAKEMNTKYMGARMGKIRGRHYAIYEEGKGYCSFDGIRAYILKSKDAMQSIIDAGGFIGEMQYVPEW